jgi:hypothetical protein
MRGQPREGQRQRRYALALQIDRETREELGHAVGRRHHRARDRLASREQATPDAQRFVSAGEQRRRGLAVAQLGQARRARQAQALHAATAAGRGGGNRAGAEIRPFCGQQDQRAMFVAVGTRRWIVRLAQQRQRITGAGPDTDPGADHGHDDPEAAGGRKPFRRGRRLPPLLALDRVRQRPQHALGGQRPAALQPGSGRRRQRPIAGLDRLPQRLRGQVGVGRVGGERARIAGGRGGRVAKRLRRAGAHVSRRRARTRRHGGMRRRRRDQARGGERLTYFG